MPDIAEIQRLRLLFNDLDRRLKAEVDHPRMSTDGFLSLMRQRDQVKEELRAIERTPDYEDMK